MPIESPDYKQISEYNSIVHKNSCIKVKDLTVGATYLGKDNVSYIYMGKFDRYDYGYWKNNIFFSTRNKMEKYCRENNLPRSKTSYRWGYDKDKYAPGLIGKQHRFCYKTNNWDKNEITTFMWKSSLNKFLISVIDENCSPQYADYFNLLEGTVEYSPIDHAKDTWHEMTLDEFKNNTSDYYGIQFFANIEGKVTKFEARPQKNKEETKYILYTYSEERFYNGDVEILDLFSTEEVEEYAYGIRVQKQHMVPVTIEEIFYRLHPLYKQTYLANGREYRK